MIRTMELRFVKRKVGRNIVRILQQKWEDACGESLWQDVPLAEEKKATQPEIFRDDP